jgi:hypothetical protein
VAEDFETKDSGVREVFAGGMQRDVAYGKTNWALVADGPMLRRWAELLARGAVKYTKRNWMLAEGAEERERARESAFRHFMQWYYGERDEDHAAAVFFNVNEAEYIREKVADAAQAPVRGPVRSAVYEEDGA